MAIQNPHKVIQGRWLWYQSKARMRFPILVLNGNLGRTLHRFGDTAAYSRKIAKFVRSNPPQSHKSPSLGVIPCEFFDESYLAGSWNHGAIQMVEEIMTLALSLLIQYRLWGQTDGQTDKHVAVAKIRSTHSAARVKTLLLLVGAYARGPALSWVHCQHV